MPVETAAPVAANAAAAGFLDLDGRSIFICHHPPAPDVRRAAAVVLCPPLGYESMSAYPTIRILAERLAAMGFDAVRFDYDGTGNSSGDYEEADRVAACVRSIDQVVAAARRLSGLQAVAIVGVRAGAMLALQTASAREGVDRLVLWSTPASGRSYVRELKAVAGLSRQQHAGEDEGPGINAAGHVMSAESIEAVQRWTVQDVAVRPAPHVLLIDRDDRRTDPALEDRLCRLGACVGRIRPRGTAGMLLQTQLATVPREAVDAIASWFDSWRPAHAGSPAASPVGDRVSLRRSGTSLYENSAPQRHPAPAGLDGSADEQSVVGGVFRPGAIASVDNDRLVRFGPGDRLFGILSSPPQDAADAPAIILFNTGVERHIGPHRMYVPLARHWAARGHVVLRFDIGGVGDSAPPPGCEPAGAYPPHMLEDASEAVAFIRRVAPGRRVVAAGMCSGGWLAFRAAREGLAVDAIAAVNPPMYLRERAGVQWVEERRELGRYRESLRDPARWMKALRGRVSYATIARLAAGAIARRASVRRAALTGVDSDTLAADLVAIARRGITARFIFSEGDEGLAYFDLHARPALRRRGVRALISRTIVTGAGHTFRPRPAQSALRELLLDFVAVQTA